MTKRVLIVGGAGFIGANLCEKLGAHGHWVGILDPQAALKQVPQAYAVPLNSTAQLEQLLHDCAVDTVIHLASSLIPSSNADELHHELAHVVQPTLRLVDLCAKARIRFVMFSSGGTVYGDAGAAVVAEGHPLAPKSLYGYAKVVMEDYVRLVGRTRALRYLVLRPSNLYGRHQRIRGAQGFIAVALGRLLNGQVLELWGDGESVRDYLDVRDLVDAVAALLEANVGNVTLNVGSGIGHSIKEVLAVIHQVTGQHVRIVRQPARSTDVKRIVLDTRALGELIDWRPRKLEDGVQDFFDHLQRRDA